VVPSYADPFKIAKYASIEAIFGERPAYVMQKKRRYEQTVWINDSNGINPNLDVIGTTRLYYQRARWAKHPSFCTCPCEPKCHESHLDFKTFSDEVWSSDDDDFSESYYNKKSELMCVRHERSGKILDAGETIVPGVGVVILQQNQHSSSHSGRIFLSNKKTEEEKKEWNMARLHQFCKDEGLSWPQKVHRTIRRPSNRKSSSSSFLTPRRLYPYLKGHPTPVDQNEALNQKTVPTEVVCGENSLENIIDRKKTVFAKPVYAHGSDIKIEDNKAESYYEPSTASRNLLSYSTQPEGDDSSSTMLPSERDPAETEASAVKAFQDSDVEDRSPEVQEEGMKKC
jgi:hypothetical protein